MKISTRNSFTGTVKNLLKGPVSTGVQVTIAPDVDVVAVISTASANELGLATGKPARVVIKASSVMIGVD